MTACINPVIEKLSLEREHLDATNISAWIQNFLLDIGGKIVLSHDFNATKFSPQLHPTVLTVNGAFDALGLLRFQRGRSWTKTSWFSLRMGSYQRTFPHRCPYWGSIPAMSSYVS